MRQQQRNNTGGSRGRGYIILADDLRAWLLKAKERGNIPGRIDDEGRQRLAELNRSRTKA